MYDRAGCETSEFRNSAKVERFRHKTKLVSTYNKFWFRLLLPLQSSFAASSNSIKPTSDEPVPGGSSIWKSFKDDVISLTRNGNEYVSSSLSSSSNLLREKLLKLDFILIRRRCKNC